MAVHLLTDAGRHRSFALTHGTLVCVGAGKCRRPTQVVFILHLRLYLARASRLLNRGHFRLRRWHVYSLNRCDNIYLRVIDENAVCITLWRRVRVGLLLSLFVIFLDAAFHFLGNWALQARLRVGWAIDYSCQLAENTMSWLHKHLLHVWTLTNSLLYCAKIVVRGIITGTY